MVTVTSTYLQPSEANSELERLEMMACIDPACTLRAEYYTYPVTARDMRIVADL
jgi:hypothetical protein